MCRLTRPLPGSNVGLRSRPSPSPLLRAIVDTCRLWSWKLFGCGIQKRSNNDQHPKKCGGNETRRSSCDSPVTSDPVTHLPTSVVCDCLREASAGLEARGDTLRTSISQKKWGGGGKRSALTFCFFALPTTSTYQRTTQKSTERAAQPQPTARARTLKLNS